jgi:putative ABC transport system substrate-binding protein
MWIAFLRVTSPATFRCKLTTKFELAINLKAARVLGLDVPAALLAHANEVIE